MSDPTLAWLDAVTYLWSEHGTSCVHLPQTHEIVKLMRDVFDTVAPGVAIITETSGRVGCMRIFFLSRGCACRAELPINGHVARVLPWL